MDRLRPQIEPNADPEKEADARRRAAQVRGDIVRGSLRGLATGVLTGLIGWPILRRYVLSPKKWGHNKYYFFSTMTAGAFGSFLGSFTSGRHSMQVVFADVFHARQVAADEAFERRRHAVIRDSSVSRGNEGDLKAQQQQQDGIINDHDGHTPSSSAFQSPFIDPTSRSNNDRFR